MDDDPRMRLIEDQRALARVDQARGDRTEQRGVRLSVVSSGTFIIACVLIPSGWAFAVGVLPVTLTIVGLGMVCLGSAKRERATRRLRELSPAGMLPPARAVER
jgi:hypothetical protein